MGYSDHLLAGASSLAAACTRRVSSAARHLLGYCRLCRSHCRLRRKHCLGRLVRPVNENGGAGSNDFENGECLWRRTILMGERCQPLDFSGAIHYDSFGRQLKQPPTPRRLAASMFCRSSDAVAGAVVVSKKAKDM